ncbi:CubicO group peptidase (beta-lactamase class C family) [Natronospira proteinivora]|uniref:CubicO group peptidase (Beta-lactamase class C family) n=1 Tax=Natronospira proteinivora TaxID=1807133 RepID=A0ABT1GB29_9GAMM|nr:serine hydrolase domain-containing protein [Natronospira proteinivora]MCP1728540.1 CubicO group peptidase (beta-lactamase class C family) [Natronospira proteinivora]
MQRVRTPGFLLLALFLVALPALASANHSEAASDSVAAQLGKWSFSGLIIEGQGDQLTKLHALGWADREGRLPFGPDTRLPWLSLSKSLTAALLLRMEADGQLALSDTLPRHFDGVPGTMSAMTLEQLLSHQSGLAAQLRHPGAEGPPEFEAIDRATLEQRVWRSEPLARPGQQFIYSNLGYNLAAAAAERAGELDFASLLEARLFQPAGMNSVHLGRGPAGSVEATAYELGYRWGRFSKRAWPEGKPGWNLIGAGGLSSDSHGLIDLLMLIRGAEPMAELASNWRRARLTTASGEAYGLGLSRSEDAQGERIGHEGGFGPFSTEIAWWPEQDRWLIIASTTRHFRAWDVRRLLSDPDRTLPAVPTESLALDLASGRHWRVHHPEGGCWLISPREDRLEIRSEGPGANQSLLGAASDRHDQVITRAHVDRLRALLSETEHRPSARDSREAAVMRQLREESRDHLQDRLEGIDVLSHQTDVHDDTTHYSEFRLRSRQDNVALRIRQDASGHWRELEWSPRETGVTAVLRSIDDARLSGIETHRLEATEELHLQDDGRLITEQGWRLNLNQRIPVSMHDGLFDSPCGPD